MSTYHRLALLESRLRVTTVALSTSEGGPGPWLQLVASAEGVISGKMGEFQGSSSTLFDAKGMNGTLAALGMLAL